MTISVAVMAHPERQRFIAPLVDAIGHPKTTVVWDRTNDRWDTGRRSLLAFDPTATHHVVVQDDAIVCRDLVAAVTELVSIVPANPISLYTGRTRPFGNEVQGAVRRAHELGLSWLVCDELFWGVGVVLPVPLIEEMIRVHDRLNVRIPNYDSKMSWYFRYRAKVRTFYTQPSLVDHRDVRENPSLVPGRVASGRVAHRFIGDADPLGVEWETDAVYLDSENEMSVVEIAGRTAQV